MLMKKAGQALVALESNPLREWRLTCGDTGLDDARRREARDTTCGFPTGVDGIGTPPPS
jgi:hypothetical protein